MALSQEQLNLLGTQLTGIVSKITTKNLDLHQRRITNAASSQDDNDYVIQKELIDATDVILQLFTAYVQKLNRVFVTKNNKITFNQGDVVAGPVGVFKTSDGTKQVSWLAGVGDPEGVVRAEVGSFYSRTDGGAGTAFYVKEVGSAENGWAAK